MSTINDSFFKTDYFSQCYVEFILTYFKYNMFTCFKYFKSNYYVPKVTTCVNREVVRNFKMKLNSL